MKKSHVFLIWYVSTVSLLFAVGMIVACVTSENRARLQAGRDRESAIQAQLDIALEILAERERRDAAELAAEEAERAYRDKYAFLDMPIHEDDFRAYTSPIGVRESPSYGGQWREHLGLDMVGTWKARIVAAADGVIIDVYPAPDGYWKGHPTKGGYVEIKHAGGFITRYSHMSVTYKMVIGEKVRRGDILGRQGNTGLSFKDHLHFEVLKDGEHVNPDRYILHGSL